MNGLLLIPFEPLVNMLVKDRQNLQTTILSLCRQNALHTTPPEQKTENNKRNERNSANIDFLDGVLARMANMAVFEEQEDTRILSFPNPLREDQNNAT